MAASDSLRALGRSFTLPFQIETILASIASRIGLKMNSPARARPPNTTIASGALNATKSAKDSPSFLPPPTRRTTSLTEWKRSPLRNPTRTARSTTRKALFPKWTLFVSLWILWKLSPQENIGPCPPTVICSSEFNFSSCFGSDPEATLFLFFRIWYRQGRAFMLELNQQRQGEN